MIIDISKPINIVCSEPFRVERTNLQQAAIDNNWKEFIKDKNPADFFNGEVFLVNNIIFDENEYVLEVGSSRYADLVYAKETGKLKVRSLFVASYIVTSDGFLCVIKNKRNRINTIGGMADDSDFLNGQFQPWKCLIREWEEEMGVNLETDSRFGEVNKRFKDSRKT